MQSAVKLIAIMIKYMCVTDKNISYDLTRRPAMNISKSKNGEELTIAIEGRLDTTTAPELDDVVKSEIEGITKLVFDFAKLEYISSAGLRVLLSSQKIMNKQGSMVVKNVSEEVNEIFEVTGFQDILSIE